MDRMVFRTMSLNRKIITSGFVLAIVLSSVGLEESVAATIEDQDALLSNTSQIYSPSNSPYFGADTSHAAAVNFRLSTQPTMGGSSVNGISFYEITGVTSGTAVTDTSFSSGVNFDYGSFTGTDRPLAATNVSGTDSTAADAMGTSTLYDDTTATPLNLDFHGLGANASVYVQLFGGRYNTNSGWAGNVDVTINGGTTLVWNSANGNAGRATIYGFEAQADSSGDLTLDLAKDAGSGYFVLSGFVLQQEVIPEPATVVLITMGFAGLALRRRRRLRN